ncbi:MAG: hypothetical protein RJA52_763 [Bacteroidota bacterium]|jgi:hypothetical protein
MKALQIFFGIVFLVFAAVQLNDPDPFFWVFIYGYIGILILIQIYYPIHQYFFLAGILICLIVLGAILPEFIEWIKMGAPTITGSMKAEAPHIEYTREFLGILLSTGTLFYYFKRSSRHPRHI